MMYDPCSFKRYVWGKTDIIGAGATSIVYKAICQVLIKFINYFVKNFTILIQDSGNYVAVKVFNEQAKLRSNVSQSRELDLLHKINHENVVKLIDKEEQNVKFKN